MSYLTIPSNSDPFSAVYLADTVILQTVGESKSAALNLKKKISLAHEYRFDLVTSVQRKYVFNKSAF